MKERLKRYALLMVDNNSNLIKIGEYNTIFELDNFTSQFENKNDAITRLKELTNKNITDIVIENRNNRQFDKIDYTHDVIYKENIIPEDDKLLAMYFKYLIEDRERIKTSSSYYRPLFKRTNVFTIPEEKIKENIATWIRDYKKRRDIYFELLKHCKIKINDNPSNKERYFNHLFKYANIAPDNPDYSEEEYYDKYDYMPKPRRKR